MLVIDQATLAACYPQAREDLLELFAAPIAATLAEYGIDTRARAAAWLAQVGHESGQLRYRRELWGPTAAQLRYEGRADLGNTEPGDGQRFLGRGLIQVTGRANYRACSLALFADEHVLLDRPQILEEPAAAARSAGWFWHTRGLNALADAGRFEALTRRINGGLNGYAERCMLHQRALDALAEWA